MPDARYLYGRRVDHLDGGRIIYSVHAANGREIDRFSAYPDEAAVTFDEAQVEPISAADLLRLPCG